MSKNHQEWLNQRRQRYLSYIASPEWNAKKKAFWEVNKKQCAGCKTTINLHVHHMTYCRMTDEDLADLVSVCKTCHEAIHKRNKETRGEDLVASTHYVLKLFNPDYVAVYPLPRERPTRTPRKQRRVAEKIQTFVQPAPKKTTQKSKQKLHPLPQKKTLPKNTVNWSSTSPVLKADAMLRSQKESKKKNPQKQSPKRVTRTQVTRYVDGKRVVDFSYRYY